MIFYLIAGLVFLVAGGEALVRGASTVATRAGISPLVVGLTVVAFGTSSPELVVSATAVFEGKAGLAVSNVVGSNIFNVLFILGLCALIAPLTVAAQLIRRDIPIMIGGSLALWLLTLDGAIDLLDGAVFFAGIIGYTVFAVRDSRREIAAIQSEYTEGVASSTPGGLAGAIALVILGLVLLVLGGRWLVFAAVDLAKSLGVSETVVGLTIVAAGTSLPEVATSIIATLRGQRDIAVGNVIGSCVFNILGILGVCGLLAGRDGLSVPSSIEAFDLPVMVAVALATLPLAASGQRLARWEGGLFLAFYVAYVAYLILAAGAHDALSTFSLVMLEFVVPLTLLTVAVLAVRAVRARAG